ncbi:MAG: protein kinase [Desulfocapsaceae bacterium]|nr:protein kinase [Desulfocapsaceae bacterium]
MKMIGRYEVVGRLGRGGMSTVYKVKAPVTGRIVALKVLAPREELLVELTGPERLRQIFIEEARIMGAISHPHVAKIIDCDENGRAPFIVLEYFSHSLGGFIGESYRAEQFSRLISVARTAFYIIQALKGLERLHLAGIIHRDIKPFNLMITSDDRIIIIDFGLSRIRGEERMRIPGLKVGSPFYAAPEQETHPEKADERADLYSLGVLAYRMLTGRLPDRTGDRTPPPSSYRPDLNRAWDELIMKSMAKHPAHRFSSAMQMRRVFEDVHADWERESTKGCIFIEETCERGACLPVRRTQKRVLYREAREDLGLDELMRPRKYQEQRPEIIDAHHIRDLNTDLIWQTRGSGYTLDWLQAEKYIATLNRQKCLGRDTWRLPTLAELLTILQPPTVTRDFCLHPAFQKDIHWLWSSDWYTKKQAWMVDIIECFVERSDKDGEASVCAVS